MQQTTSINIESLLGRPLWQMTGQDLCELTRFASEGILSSLPTTTKQAIGIHKLAEELGCSASMLYELKKKGILDDSIISHIGKKVVFDIDKARELANRYQDQQRSRR